MKTLLQITLLFLFTLLIGCGTTQPSESEMLNTRPDDAVSDVNKSHQNLADFLWKLPGLHVRGSGNNVSITVQGISSFNAGTDPLYVIDGQAVGTDYTSVNSMLNVQDIDYVRVLKGSDATIYGIRGANGVILITTKK